MAQLYTIRCPKCKSEFKVPKGVFMNWDFSIPVPHELQEDAPFHCPNCNHTMSVMDEDFNNHVMDISYID